MKSALFFLWFLGTGCLLSAQDEKQSPTNIVSEAEVALRRLERINIELNEIFRKKEDGYRGGIGLTDLEKKREKELYEERSVCLTQTKKVAEMLKVGTSVFSYSGLIALSDIEYDPKKNVYSMRLVISYRHYEDGESRHPTYKVIEFDHVGLITRIEDFATVRMVRD
jgi:hypothetical protein